MEGDDEGGEIRGGVRNNDDELSEEEEEEEEDMIDWFERVSDHAGQVQSRTLRQILHQNCGAEYLKQWLGDVNILEIQDDFALESFFSSSVPLSSHPDYHPYLQRIADGDTAPLLTQQPIKTLSLRVYPIREGGKILEFIYSSKQTKTKGGITTGTATTHYYASEEFKIKQRKTKCFSCSPPEVISGGDHKQSTYCHLLLGLFFRDEVEFVASTFAYSVVQAFNELEMEEGYWDEICRDIAQGTLSSRITLPNIRSAVLKLMSPNPSLASTLRGCFLELQSQDWLGLVPKLWPNCKYVYSIMTGSMQPYLKKLRHYAGGIPLVSGDYGSTESWIGVNVDPSLPPENVTFTVVPTFSYFEFIPLFTQHQLHSSHQPIDDFFEAEPIPLSQVQIGQQYELVLTTFTGLYRYRLGDVVEVAGFHKKTPKLNFICRRKLVLSINIDKNTEKDVQMVVERGSQLLGEKSGAELVDFTSHAEGGERPGHYVIFWEIKGEVEDRVVGECCTEMDAAFVDYGYVVSRKSNSIGPLELRIVERGTFKKILEHYIGNGAALSQFKTPRCTTNHLLLAILNLSTVKAFRSTAYA